MLDYLTRTSLEIIGTAGIGHTFDWLFGGFYTHESSATDQNIYAASVDHTARFPNRTISGIPHTHAIGERRLADECESKRKIVSSAFQRHALRLE